jgi:hypothetical protein
LLWIRLPPAERVIGISKTPELCHFWHLTLLHVTLATSHSLFSAFLRIHKRGTKAMKINYEFTKLDPVERVYIEHLLLEQIEKQNWFSIVRFQLLRYEYLVCMQ